MKQNLCCLSSKIDRNFEKGYFFGDDKDDDDDDDDADDDIYIMVKCVSVCLSRKMIIVCLFVMFYGFAR